MRITMPANFPEEHFLKFGVEAAKLFPRRLSNEHLEDPLQRLQHFDGSWSAVRYRYRACADCDTQLKAMLADESEWDIADEEKRYQLNRLVYEFFTNALSVYESFFYCLYFVGHAMKSAEFDLVEKNLRGINPKSTEQAFNLAFPQLKITTEIARLRQNIGFRKIDELRNLLAHRVSGMRSSSRSAVLNEDGSFTETSREDLLYIPGATTTLQFDTQLFERELNPMAAEVNKLAVAASEFVENINLAIGHHGN